MVTGLRGGTQMFFDGYKSRLRTIKIALVATFGSYVRTTRSAFNSME